MAGEAGRLIALAAIAAACGAAIAHDPVKALAGRYSHLRDNGDVSGNSYKATDVVEVVPVDARHAYISLDLQFFNGHACALDGIAEARGRGLTYVEPTHRTIGGERCTLEIARQGKKLVWDDKRSCSAYCGARGTFSKGEIAWSSRRPIWLARYLDIDSYRRAITEWRTGKAVEP